MLQGAEHAGIYTRLLAPAGNNRSGGALASEDLRRL
jgi:hypothetical protein